jgi:putative ABC transport system permease protein
VFGDAGGLDGQALVLDGQPYTIVGVADATFEIPNARVDVWRPAGFMRTRSPWMSNPRGGGFQVFARLTRGATPTEAQAQVDAICRVIDENLRATILPLRDQFLPASSRTTLLVLWAAVGLLLTIACVNVTNLVLTRDVARAREAAVRIALGATRARMLRRALIEQALLVGGGAAAGLTAAALLLRLLRALAPGLVPRMAFVRIDGAVVAFTCAIAVAVVCALALVSSASRPGPVVSLRASAFAATGGRRARRIGQALVAVEIALSVVLLVGAALVGRSLANLLAVDLGIENRQVTAALVDESFGRTLSLADQRLGIERIVSRVSQLPGVISAGAGASLPPNLARLRFTLDRFDDAPGAPANYMVDAVTATPGYFTTLALRLRDGRMFDDHDDASRAPVGIVTETTARQIFGDRPAIGRVIHLPAATDAGPGNQAVTIVGVVDDVRYSGLEVAPNGVIFRPFAQQPWPSMFIVAGTSGDPQVFASTLRRAITDVDPSIAIYSVDTMDALVGGAVAQPAFRAGVLASLAAIALALAGVGLYGVIAFGVSQRTREIGIRMALGTTRRAIAALVLRETMRLASVGLAAGLAAAAAVSSALRSLLYGVAPGDLGSFAGAGALVALGAVWAAAVPVWRASRADPVTALRAE